jgi:hypothetical protein
VKVLVELFDIDEKCVGMVPMLFNLCRNRMEWNGKRKEDEDDGVG